MTRTHPSLRLRPRPRHPSLKSLLSAWASELLIALISSFFFGAIYIPLAMLYHAQIQVLTDTLYSVKLELPPAKRRKGLTGSIVSTALSAALIGTAVGLTVYRLWVVVINPSAGAKLVTIGGEIGEGQTRPRPLRTKNPNDPTNRHTGRKRHPLIRPMSRIRRAERLRRGDTLRL